jgi:hypothetical protein
MADEIFGMALEASGWLCNQFAIEAMAING